MSEDLPWTVVVSYAILAVFANQQKFCVREFRGASKGYELALGYFMAATSIFAIGYLIVYGFKVSWWAPFVLFAGGAIAWIPTLFLERLIPMWIWGLASFPIVPVCAYILIRSIPTS